MTQVASNELNFYTPETVNDAEARRLEMMAYYADLVSLKSMGDAIDVPGAVCVDVGAGDSTSLGNAILEKNTSASYIPIDIREDALAKHTAAGFDAKAGYATDLPLPDNVANVTHARFVHGWLDEEGRRRSLGEMLRVGADSSRAVIIDYDWNAAKGPEPVDRLIGRVTELMHGFGFNPGYGDVAADEVKRNLAQYGYDGNNSEVTVERTHIADSLGNVLGTVQQTILPILDTLNNFGLTADASELSAMLEEVGEYASLHPETMVSLPDIVAVIVDCDNARKKENAHMALVRAHMAGEQVVSSEVFQQVGPPELNTFRFSDDMILQARRLHASSFHDHGYVTNEGMTPEGTLIESIDSKDVIRRSLYIGSFNDRGKITGNIRMIEPENENPMSLPTVEKIVEALGDDDIAIRSLPFMNGASVFEASALGKSSESRDKLIMTKLLLATFCEAKNRGYDYAVMGIVANTARLMTAIYGPDVFKRIDGDAAVVHLTGEGINPQGVKLVPFYVEIDTFTQLCMERFSGADSDLAKDSLRLFDLTHQYMQS